MPEQQTTLARARERVRSAPRPNLLERRMSRFFREPPSIKSAASVIVTATTLIVVGAGVLIRILDHHEYASVWVGMWWALQTVTTVGYGDVTPHRVAGRIVGVFVMLQGIAFLAIVTAAITSSFVARAQSERARADAEEEEEIVARLDRIESMLRELERRP